MPEHENQDPQVHLTAIDGALAALLNKAEATDLAKAYGGTSVETTGHVDESGKTSGAMAGGGDVGGLDKMMIAKMTADLVAAGHSADAIAAFMSKDDDEEEEDGGDDEEEEKGFEYDLGKSLDGFTADEAIAAAIDVSPFLEAMVQRTAEQIDGLAKSLGGGFAHQAEVNKSVAVALNGIGQLVKGFAPILHALNERLSLVESQPAPQRGHTQLSGAQAVLKSFGQHGLEGGAGQPQRLTKGQVVRTLNYMQLEKGVQHIGGRPMTDLVVQLEAGNQLAPQTMAAVQQFLATHPSEADLALTYA